MDDLTARYLEAKRRREASFPFLFRPRVRWEPENIVALKGFLRRRGIGKKRIERWLKGPPDTGLL
jgi:hypothetical protein